MTQPEPAWAATEAAAATWAVTPTSESPHPRSLATSELRRRIEICPRRLLPPLKLPLLLLRLLLLLLRLLPHRWRSSNQRQSRRNRTWRVTSSSRQNRTSLRPSRRSHRPTKKATG